MAAWSRTEKTVTTVEYTLPAPAPWGACWNEMSNVIDVARREYMAHYGQRPSDDAIRVLVTDEEIKVVFEKEAVVK